MSENCIKNTIGRLTVEYYQSVYPHGVAPCHNLHRTLDPIQSGHDVIYETSNLFRQYQYNATRPLPWFPPVQAHRPALNGLDPCWIPVDKKQSWEKSKRVLLKACKNKGPSPGFLENLVNENPKNTEIPLNIALLAKHLENDPDDQFSGSYNWYFGGSNVESVTVDGKMYVARPNYTEDGTLLLTKLKLGNGHWVPSLDDTYRIKTGEKEMIYQIDVSNANFLVRQKGTCSLFRICKTSDLFVKHCTTVRRKFPFVSCSLSPLEPNNFVTLSTNRELCLWNSSLKRPVCCSVIPNEEPMKNDNWGNIHYYDSNSLLFADRTAINVIDSRVGLGKIQIAWAVEKLTEVCEQIYHATPGSHDLQYVITNHQMFGLDLRQGFIQRWTHMVPNSPCIVKVLKQRGLVDTVFIGSLHGDTLVAIENRWDESNSVESRVHPLTLPSMRESLHAVRYQGHCLSSIVGERFCMSLTGICCIEDEDINVIRCTSLGDIFIQRLVRKNSHSWTNEFNARECEKLIEWERKCKVLMKKSKWKCVATAVKHVSHIMEDLKVEVDSTTPVNTSLVENNERPKWCISKAQLLKYCDYLAPKLLEIWDLDKEEEWDLRPAHSDEENEVVSDEDDFVEKVTKWIDSYATEFTQNEDEEDVDNKDLENTNNEIHNPDDEFVAPEQLSGIVSVDIDSQADAKHTENDISQSPAQSKSLHTQVAPIRKRRGFVSGF